MTFRLDEVAGAQCQMGDYPFVNLDEVVEAADGATSVADVAAVAGDMGLQITPPQH